MKNTSSAFMQQHTQQGLEGFGAYLNAFGQVAALFLQCLHVHMHIFVR